MSGIKINSIEKLFNKIIIILIGDEKGKIKYERKL